jgi:MraZ protein
MNSQRMGCCAVIGSRGVGRWEVRWGSIVEPTFSGCYINKIDAKGRVSVPAPFRSKLARPEFQGITAVQSVKWAMIEGSGSERTDALARQLEEFPEDSEEYEALQALFGEHMQIPADTEGRIILPQPLLAHANLSDVVLFAGGGNVFQMWEPGAYEAYKVAMRDRRQKGGASLFKPRSALKGEGL